MQHLYRIIAFFVGLLVAAQAGATEYGRYHSLVIGISEYQHLPRLETAVNDASALHDLLSRDYDYDSTLLLNPTRRQLIEAFDRLRAELTPKDNVLIFYAGHGYLDRATGEGYWLTVNAKEDSQVDWLPVASVTWLLKATLAQQALVIVDSCYSGTLTRDAPVAPAMGPARAAELTRLAHKRSRKALTSGGLEPVYDGGGDGYSVFTRALLDTLHDRTEVIDGFQLFTKVRGAVVLNAEQTPQYGDIRLAGDEGGDYLFVPTAASRPASSPAATVVGPDKEALFWQAIQDSTAATDYEAYLAQYPNGTFAPLARARATRYAKSAQAPAPAASSEPAEDPGEIVFWNSIKDSAFAADFEAYLAQYPDGQFATLAAIRQQALQHQAGERRAEEAERQRQAAAEAEQQRQAAAEEAERQRQAAAEEERRRQEAEAAAAAKQQQAALTPATEPSIELEPVETFYVLTKNANVRAEPTVDSEAVTTLRRGTELYVPARTPDGLWLQVAQGSTRLGFVYAPLLQEQAAWQAEQEAEAERQADDEAKRRMEEAVRRRAAELARRSGTGEATAASGQQVAAVVPPRPGRATGPSKWRLRIDVSTVLDGHLGTIQHNFTYAGGKYESGIVESGAMRLWAYLTMSGGKVKGEVMVRPGSFYADHKFDVDGPLRGDGYDKTTSASILEQRGSYVGDSKDVIVRVRLEPLSPGAVALASMRPQTARAPAAAGDVDGRWTARLVVDLADEGRMIDIERKVEIDGGRYRSGPIVLNRAGSQLTLTISNNSLSGELELDPGGHYMRKDFTFKGTISGDVYEQEIRDDLFSRQANNDELHDVKIRLRLERAR